jgi:hypothetical protein
MDNTKIGIKKLKNAELQKGVMWLHLYSVHTYKGLGIMSWQLLFSSHLNDVNTK